MTKISRSRMDMQGGRLDNALLKDYNETLVGGTGGVNTTASYTVDISTGNVFYLVLNAATVTFTFSNPAASGVECSFVLLLKQDTTGGRLASWPASVKWPGNRAPVLSTAGGKVNVISFSSPDGGTTWFGLPSGAEFTPGIGFPLFGWGANTSGSIGDNTIILRSSPVQVGAASNWDSVAATTNTSFAIDRNGALWSWGTSGNYGIAGRNVGNNNSVSSPVQIGTLTNWATITPTGQTAHAVTTTGQLFGWGQGTTGQVGDNAAINRSSPVQIGTLTNWVTAGVSNPGGVTFASAIDTSGQIWTWGSNTTGFQGTNDVATVASRSSPVQIGTLTNWSSQLARGGAFTEAVKTDGTLWAWGNPQGNAQGAVGHNDLTIFSSPVQIGTLTNWSKVAAAQYGVSAIKTDGTLWGWGNNVRGEVGDSSHVNRSSPVQIGTLTNWLTIGVGLRHHLAVKTDGTLWGWGLGTSGQLAGLVPVNASSPIQVGAATTWAALSAGASHTVAIDSSGRLWTWGLNTSGQLGQNFSYGATSSPVQVGTLTNWASVSAGDNHVLALDTSNRLWVWGLNSSAQLGDNTAVTKSSPVQIGTLTNWTAVAAGAANGAGIDSSGRFWAWGRNNEGQLGQNNVTAKSSPVQVGTLTNWTSVTWGGYVVLGIDTSSKLWGWGQAASGQLGDNTAVNKSSPVQIGTLTNWSKVFGKNSTVHAIKTDGTLWGWGIGNSGQIGQNLATTNVSSPAQVGTLTNWSTVGAGNTHRIATDTSGRLWSWGAGTYGRIGDNNITNRSSPVQIGTLTNWPTAAGTLTGGNNFNMAIKTDNTLWGWGYRGPGALGDGQVSFLNSPAQIGTLTSWTKVAGGSGHSFGLSPE